MPDDTEGQDEYGDRLEQQMRGLMRALKTGDTKAAAAAFRAAHAECASEDEPDGDESDMMEE